MPGCTRRAARSHPGSRWPNGRAYAGDPAGNVYAVNARSGDQIWVFTTYGTIDSGIAVAGGLVYFGGGANSLYAVRA
jgi:eukaryotic-like serine/threonine-protein kinase